MNLKMNLKFLEPYTARWRALQPRERYVVSAAAIALALILVSSFWLPMQRDINRLRTAVPQAHTQLAQMRLQSTQIAQLRASGISAGSGGNILAKLEQSATARGLKQNITRMEPEGTNNARVTLDGVNFDALAEWLADLQSQSGLRVEKASVETRPVPGTVNARLVMRGAGS
jgi:general secretion pathway protein M